MKVPKVITTYCPKCKTHTEHSVSLYKGGKRRTLSEGQRRYDRKNIGYGSKRKPEQKRFAKTTKKQTLVLKCQKCGYTIMREGLRMKKIELVEVVK
ncbi:50S ribosomal protein L44e [Sulfurisphaera tokodaii]|uniref:Large ribosomal subunit protein eL42 n=2 Tax=Sulfurisphaera tokodaii TaxID=111955 RepID=Q973F8_SULTO|nr:50S ribosomal protein L44e [Sulfurisphaera tokodaii]BAB65955.1 50S ribosomal protein L44e [Sulfurisphaera tokodaii str. 7]HII73915.1 50S ribosomal protein L44e [Sulfurisphaera tokodaii]